MAVAALAVLQQAAGAIGGVVDALKKLPDVVRPFVDAFDPTQGQRLDYAFRSLYATIGYALSPVIGAATRTVEQFADAISAGMDALRGPIEKVAGVFLGVLQPAMAAASHVMDALAEGASALEPLLAPLGEAFAGLLAVADILATVLSQSLLAAIKALIPSEEGLKSITDFVVDAFTGMAEATIAVSTTMLAAFGQAKLMKPILEALVRGAPQGGRRQGAPENFQIGGIEDVYRRRLLLAAQGRAQDLPQMQFDVLKRIHDVLVKQLELLEKDPDAFERAAEQRVKRDTETAVVGSAGILGPLLQKLINAFRQDDRNRP